MSETLKEVDEIAKTIPEVAPPGWGHTKAEKSKTDPSKPKSKIGGSIEAMKKAQARGDIPKDMNIFALAWSMKNKGDNPHYEPGKKDVLKKKYKGPEGQNEEVELDELTKKQKDKREASRRRTYGGVARGQGGDSGYTNPRERSAHVDARGVRNEYVPQGTELHEEPPPSDAARKRAKDPEFWKWLKSERGKSNGGKHKVLQSPMQKAL